MRFVVVGTGRSGTGYIASLFNAAGLRCGHEDVYNVQAGVRDVWVKTHRPTPLREMRARLGEERRRRRARFDGDASWMAVPRLPHFRGAAFLQVRDPLAVVSSFQGTRFFDAPADGQVPDVGLPLRTSM